MNKELVLIERRSPVPVLLDGDRRWLQISWNRSTGNFGLTLKGFEKHTSVADVSRADLERIHAAIDLLLSEDEEDES